MQAAAHMQQGRVLDLDAALAMTAGKQSHQPKPPMADSLTLATARRFETAPWP